MDTFMVRYEEGRELDGEGEYAEPHLVVAVSNYNFDTVAFVEFDQWLDLFDDGIIGKVTECDGDYRFYGRNAGVIGEGDYDCCYTAQTRQNLGDICQDILDYIRQV